MSRDATRPSWFLLGGVTALGPLAMGVHVPALDDIALALGETVFRAQLSVPTFIFALGFGMFIAGDVADRVGLRLALSGGLVTFSLGALFAGSTGGLALLLTGRVLMGAGAAFAIVVPRVAVATDPTQSVKGLARLAAVQSTVPALAPLLGVALVAWLGWRATFLLPGAVAVALLLATALALPRPDGAGGNGSTTHVSAYASLRSRAWLLPTSEIALVTAIFLVLLAQTSNLLARPFDLDSGQVGFVLALTGAAFVVGSVLLARAKAPASVQPAARVGFVGAMILLAVGSSCVQIWAIGLVVYAIANGVLVPAAFGDVARAAPASKGRALGAASAIQMLGGAAGGAAANSLGGLTPLTFGVGGVLVALAVLALAGLNRGPRRFIKG
jgi:MFS transporter, DHA1 family, multidrug resistance protein